MLDVGLGELIVIAVLALLVFGPDRLPKVAADAARTLRQLRSMAVAARKDLSDAAGLENDEELAKVVRDIRDLDPRRALRGLGDDPIEGATKPSANGARPGSVASAGSAGGASGSTAKPPASSAAAAAAGASTPGEPGAGAMDGSSPHGDDAQLTAGPVLDAAPADPDWT